MIAIVDYGAGNVNSVKNALDHLGVQSVIVTTPEELLKAKRIILPGVGAFGFMMDKLREKGLETPIKNAITAGTPLLGICVGIQVLFEESEENPGVRGLGIFRGKVLKFRKGKVPQIGWNRVHPPKEGIFMEGYAYFVNSYYVVPTNKKIIAATTDYHGKFASAVQSGNVTAVQFHLEKSGDFGLETLRRWLSC
ncbi:TPA: imidazole glycerol phosphate synthase subunit HisH [Candidatus Woesearchaeota archaeon]|nr:imidazole glycerol phosphate synthase subunit HisH [Candidatus Woesearchaeota archaeon]HII64366.1 imidazole glycerol phosphate synthase subunit HisH [Candidatus Woesearchaeota archaeon]HIJ18618.1 imidazole glycerol phosphate synthase subunit HisH [Candidatus Woesearchaeota archaeon]